MEQSPPYAAIVLAGGAGSRLGGVDKAEIDTGRGTLLRRALNAAAAATTTVVVGPMRDLPSDRDGVVFARERPPGGGPAAAVAAGLDALVAHDSAAAEADGLVVVLACDMPLVEPPDLDALVRRLAAQPTADAVMYADSDGRRQYLAAAYRAGPLRGALDAEGDPSGVSMRSVVGRLTVAELAAHSDLTLDCDTWPDVERTRRLLEDR